MGKYEKSTFWCATICRLRKQMEWGMIFSITQAGALPACAALNSFRNKGSAGTETERQKEQQVNQEGLQTKRQNRMPWIMLACAAGMNFIFPGMLYNTLGVYTPIILREYPAFPRSLFVFAITLGNLVTAAANVFYPKLRGKLGLRGMILLGAAAILSGLFLYSSAKSLPVFYVAAALMGFSIATCASVSTVLIVNNWFAKRRGTLVAVAMAGTGIGCAAFSAVYGVWIEQIGWRASMRLSGVAAAVLIKYKSTPHNSL